MISYAEDNAIRQAASKCKAEMEATTDLQERRGIIDRHLAPLRLKFGTTKPVLQLEIYRLTYDK